MFVKPQYGWISLTEFVVDERVFDFVGKILVSNPEKRLGLKDIESSFVECLNKIRD